MIRLIDENVIRNYSAVIMVFNRSIKIYNVYKIIFYIYFYLIDNNTYLICQYKFTVPENRVH